MDFFYNLALGLLMLFVAYMVASWSQHWWRVREGYSWDASVERWYITNATPKDVYLVDRAWTWLVRLAAWSVAVWHLILAGLWFFDLAFALVVS